MRKLLLLSLLLAVPAAAQVPGPAHTTGTSTAFTGNNTHSGAETFGNINNIRIVDGTKFAQTAAGVNAADADLGTGTGEIWVPSNVTSLTGTNIVLSKHHYLVFLGNGPITVSPIRLPDSSTDKTADSGLICPDHAKLLLAASSNADLLANSSFSTLTGSGNTFGAFRVILRGCRFDGNKANQAALVTTGNGTITNIARSAGGVVTINFSNTPSPAFAAGYTVNVSGTTADTSSFNGRFVVQSASATQITYNQVGNTVAQVGSAGTSTGYSGGNGVRIYGPAPLFEDITIANNVLDGLWTEGRTPPSFTDDTTVLSGTFRSMKLANSGGDGWVFWGPQQSQSFDLESFNHGQWGRELFQPITDAHTVSFLNSSGSLHVFAGIQQTASQESSAAGWGILIEKPSGPASFSSEVAACNGCIGVEFRTQGHVFQGTVQNSSTGVKFNGGGANLHLVMSNNTTWFDCTSEAGNVLIDVENADTIGTMKGPSCWTFNEFLRLPTVAGNTTGFQMPSSAVVAAGGFVYTWPTLQNDTLVGLNSTQTLTNKTLTAPAISSPAFSGAATGTAAFLPITLLNSGTGASSTTFWRGDGTWASASATVEVAEGCNTALVLNATTIESSAGCPLFFLTSARTLTRIGIFVTGGGAGCTAAAIISMKDVTSGTNIQSLTLAVNPVVGNVDSGAISTAMTAAHAFQMIVSTAATGCTTIPIGKMWAEYQ